jgi:two-component system, NtrC family, sensor histidine kinase KinB
MKIKSKISIGVFSLFGLILVIGGLGIYYLHELSNDAKNIIRNNYETLHYTARIISAADSLPIDSIRSIEILQKNIALQEANITETGERELTNALRLDIASLSTNPLDSLARLSLRKHAIAIQDVNMAAIVRKSELAQRTASNGTTYVIMIGSVFGLMAFTFILNFPGYIANPIMQLTNSIKAIAKKDYEERLYFDRKDEFEELAQAFNQMAEKLDEYEHSNLANILFEKKRIETIINRMSDPVIGLDEKKKIVFANDQSLQLLNLTHEQIVGRYAPDVAVENDLLRSLIRTDENQEKSGSLKIVVNGKENYFSKETIAIRHTPTGEKETLLIGLVILLKNITPYKELDLAKTNFIATISHELKTPIASLQMCAKLLDDARVGKLNEEQNKIVKTLGDESSRLSKLVNELLDLSQVETGNIKLKLEAVDPLFVIEQAVESVKFQAERKNIKIEVQAADSSKAIQADREKSTWVLVNLLTNAIRYNPENEKIQIRLKQSNGKAIFSVQDFGKGIEEKYLPKLFDKFFQVPGTPQGTGLGLAISKEFAEAMGGTISVSSEWGQGSVFSFIIPMHPA